MLSQQFPTSVEEALALGYSMSQVDELRANLKRQNQPRPVSSSKSRQQHSFPSIASGGSSDDDDVDVDDSESVGSKNNNVANNGIDLNLHSVERAVGVANHQAMLLLVEGDFEGSRMFLNQAEQVLNETPESNDEQVAILLSGLQVLTWNNEASWWKSTGDPAKALEVLGQALQVAENTRLPSTDRATTCSNLAAVLSQLDRHPLALTYAQEAVMHCKAALKEAKDTMSFTQTQEANIKNVRTVTGTFAVACHNLAVEVGLLFSLYQISDIHILIAQHHVLD
jgi:tetratricopeptide (TPR) repeat protein